jgi:hypothetical protein
MPTDSRQIGHRHEKIDKDPRLFLKGTSMTQAISNVDEESLIEIIMGATDG